jgi:hypothetical protein
VRRAEPATRSRLSRRSRHVRSEQAWEEDVLSPKRVSALRMVGPSLGATVVPVSAPRNRRLLSPSLSWKSQRQNARSAHEGRLLPRATARAGEVLRDRGESPVRSRHPGSVSLHGCKKGRSLRDFAAYPARWQLASARQVAPCLPKARGISAVLSGRVQARSRASRSGIGFCGLAAYFTITTSTCPVLRVTLITTSSG